MLLCTGRQLGSFENRRHTFVCFSNAKLQNQSIDFPPTTSAAAESKVAQWTRLSSDDEGARWSTMSPTTWRRSALDESCLKSSPDTCRICCRIEHLLSRNHGRASWTTSITPSCPVYVYSPEHRPTEHRRCL